MCALSQGGQHLVNESASVSAIASGNFAQDHRRSNLLFSEVIRGRKRWHPEKQQHLWLMSLQVLGKTDVAGATEAPSN
jgi:hypothetical protein